MKKIKYILLLILCFSCDPMDNRMNIVNNSGDVIHSRIISLTKENFVYVDGHTIIQPHSRKIIGRISSWESEFDEIEPDSLLQVVIFKNFNFLNDTYEQSSNLRSDSLLSLGEYQYKSYSYKDLEKRDWKVVYPDDGFEKGYPIKHSDN